MRNQLATESLFGLSHHGRRGARFPAADVPVKPLDEIIPKSALSTEPTGLPEVTESDVIRHFVNLSTLNMCVDTHFYPLGSCTMKYNPKRHERLASLPGIVDLHPYQDLSGLQGMLELLYETQEMLAEISGLPAVSLQPAAGAQGEFTALLTAKAYFEDRGEKKNKSIVPQQCSRNKPRQRCDCRIRVCATGKQQRRTG